MTSFDAILDTVVELGSAWAGNSVNCVPFRYSALVSRQGRDIVGFFDAAGAVVVAEVGRKKVVNRQVIANDIMPDDAHQAISLGLDPSGRIHVAWGAHNSVLQVARSRAFKLKNGFVDASAIQADAGITYPMFIDAPGELVLLFRSGPHFRGQMMVRRHDADTGAWIEDLAPLISGWSDNQSCGPYVNTPTVAGDGRLVLFIVWRLPGSATSAGAVVNAGIDCMCSADGLRSLQTYGGVQVHGTVTPACSERVIATPLGCSLINQSTAAAMPDGRPAILTYWDMGDGIPQYRLGWPGQDGWRVAQASLFQTPFRLDGRGTLPLPHSRPELLFDDDGRALVIYRSVEQASRLMLTILDPPEYDVRASQSSVLFDEDLGQYEPIISRAAWRSDRSVVAYVQHCRQGMGRDGRPDRGEAAARLVRWRLKPRRSLGRRPDGYAADPQ